MYKKPFWAIARTLVIVVLFCTISVNAMHNDQTDDFEEVTLFIQSYTALLQNFIIQLEQLDFSKPILHTKFKKWISKAHSKARILNEENFPGFHPLDVPKSMEEFFLVTVQADHEKIAHLFEPCLIKTSEYYELTCDQAEKLRNIIITCCQSVIQANITTAESLYPNHSSIIKELTHEEQ